MRKVVGVFLSLAFFTISEQEVRFVEAETLEEYQTVLKVSREKDHLLFVALHDGGNAFRSMFEANVFKDPNLVKSFENFTAIAIDVRDEMGARWVSLFPPDSLPTFYFLNQEEFLLTKLEGFQNSEKLREQTFYAEQHKNRYDALLDLYNKNQLNQAQWLEIIDLYSLNFSFPQTAKLVLEYLNSLNESQLMQKPMAQLLTTYGVSLETKYPNFIKNHEQELKKVLPQFSYKEYYQTAYSYNLDLAIVNADTMLLEKIAQELIPSFPGSAADQKEQQSAAYKLFAEETELFQYWQKGALLKAGSMAKNSEAAQYLFDEGFNLADTYNDSTALVAANHLATESLAKEETYKAKMLQAYTTYLLKNYDLALTQVRKAMALSSNSKEVRQASSLMKMIEKADE